MVMRVRRRQVRSKLEKIPGTPDVASPGDALADADALYVLDPTFREPKEVQQVDGGSGTLSPERPLAGVFTAELSYGLLLRGRGLTTLPEFDRMLLAAGARREALSWLEMDTTAGNGGTFLGGETINFSGSGAVGIVARDTAYADGGKLFYRLLSGTPADTDDVTGVSSLAKCGIASGMEAETGGYSYRPDSEVGQSATHGGWSGSTPADGDVIRLQGDPTQAGTVIAATASTLLWEQELGQFLNGDTLEVMTGAAAGSTCTLGSIPAQARGLTTTEEINQDGMRRQAWGCRANVTIPAEAAQPLRINCQMQGMFGGRATTNLGSPTLDSSDVKQFKGAKYRVRVLGVGSAADYKFVISALTWSTNNTIARRPDPEANEGIREFVIPQRAPSLRIDPEMVKPAIYDWYGHWEALTALRHYVEFPGSEGQRVTLHCGAAVFSDIQDGDRDGVLTAEAEALLTRVGTGDDEWELFVT